MGGLVLGRSGQVASHLRERLGGAAAFWGREEQDLHDTPRIVGAIVDLAPTFIVNAAAYTAVDKAESEPAGAWRLNADAAAAIAIAAARLDVPLVHLSTDYVFDGMSSRPYEPDDPVRPINVYGKSKLAGELAAASLCPKHWILRTSWVFSEHGSNFVKTMLRLAAERDELGIVDDQIGVPTYAGDLARLIEALVEAPRSERPGWGLYHAVGGPPVSWCGFAKRIFERARAVGLLDKHVAVRGISTADYPTPARRPADSTLAASRALLAGLGASLDWRCGLDATLARMMSKS